MKANPLLKPTMNFEKHFSTYNDYAYVQKKVAQDFIRWIPKMKADTALEIGCGTGIFTEQIIRHLQPEVLTLNDYYDTRPFLFVPYSNFLQGDIEKIEIPEADIILSSSVFQWIEKLDTLLEKLAKKCSTLAFSMYIEGNLQEIKDHFDTSLTYKTTADVNSYLKKHFPFVEIDTSTYTVDFQQPIDALKHLKYTGVANTQNKTSLEKLRNFHSKTLTYKIGYFYAHR